MYLHVAACEFGLEPRKHARSNPRLMASPEMVGGVMERDAHLFLGTEIGTITFLCGMEGINMSPQCRLARERIVLAVQHQNCYFRITPCEQSPMRYAAE